MTNKDFWRTFFGRGERETALITAHPPPERAHSALVIDNTWYADDGSQVMLYPGRYESLRHAVRAIRYSGQHPIRFKKDAQGWYCAVFHYANGSEALYGLDLRRRCIANRSRRTTVKVTQTITLSRTFRR